MAKIYVGLDVGSSVCSVVAMDGAGATVAAREFRTSEQQLRETIGRLTGEVHLNLEACELAAWARGVVQPLVHRVVVSDPRTNAWIAKDPLKSDHRDAFKLADLLRMNRVHEIFMSDDTERVAFKHLVRHYDDLTGEEVRLKCKLGARLRWMGVLSPNRPPYTDAARAELVPRVPRGPQRALIEQLYDLLDYTLDRRAETKRLLQRAGRAFPEIRAFQTVPGVGVISASRFGAYIQTPHRFRTKRQLWRYCQLGVTNRSSNGQLLSRRCLDRSGNGRLKAVSRTAFLGAMRRRDDNALQRTYRAAVLRGQAAHRARLTIQRKILTILWTIWKDGTTYDEGGVTGR